MRRLSLALAAGFFGLVGTPTVHGEDQSVQLAVGRSEPPAVGPEPFTATPLWEVGGSERFEGARTPPLAEYRARVDDQLEFLFRLPRMTDGEVYLLHPGDVLQTRSYTTTGMSRTLTIEPDGMLSVPVIGRIEAAGRTIEAVRDELNSRAAAIINDPDFAIVAVKLFSALGEFQSSVSNRNQHGELGVTARVSPDGTVQLPAVRSVPVAGLTLQEVQREVEARYAAVLEGVRVTVLLRQQAASRVTILGEVERAGQRQIDKPTSVTQAITLAGGWVNGADLKRVVVFRRDANWRLIATSLDLRDALLGKSLANQNEIWLRDGDIVLVPKTTLRRIDDAIQLVFTNGLYKLLPIDPIFRYTRTSGDDNVDDDAVATPPIEP